MRLALRELWRRPGRFAVAGGALVAGVPRTGADIIGIEQKGVVGVEGLVALAVLAEQELLEEPGGMRAMPFRRTGIGHRLHDLILRAQQRGAAFGLGPNGTESIAPDAAWIVR